jgi:peptidoglycan hydrolase-like protein with peptidoglycan-binding domain
MDPALHELLAEGAPDDEVAVVLRLAPDRPAPPGVRIVARFGAIATCRLQRGDILLVRADPAVHSMKAPHLYGPEPELPADVLDGEDAEAGDVAPRATDVRRPPDLPETGQGVVVAHIDWGADIAHPDFRHADGRTRFAALWDQAGTPDPERPNRYGYGRIHTAADIDRALRTDDPYAALGYHPGRARPAGGSHGSHTLGISAGSGLAGGPAGVAPDAILVFVDLATSQQAPGSGLGDSAALLEALDFIASIAAELGHPGPPLPLVVNASLGRQAGEHDGETLTEQAMDAFLQAAPGRAIVQSTGNYFGRHVHASGLLRPGGRTAIEVVVADRHPPHEIDLWYPGPDLLAIEVRGPAGVEPAFAVPGIATVLHHDGRPVGRLYHRRFDPNNGDHEVAVYLDAGAPSGCWELRLLAEDAVDGRWHAWIERGPGPGAAQAIFAGDDDTPCCTLGTICNGRRTIAVGAVDAHARGRPLAHFSSGGPTRDGRGKPDLVAPGLSILSCRSASLDGVDDPLWMRMSGTSMAAPHVAGCTALMFAAAPRPLAIAETRRLLLAATQPALPPSDAVTAWRLGAGHLDIPAAVEAARRVGPFVVEAAAPAAAAPALADTRSEAMPTNPADPATNVAPESAADEAAPSCGCATAHPAAAEVPTLETLERVARAAIEGAAREWLAQAGLVRAEAAPVEAEAADPEQAEQAEQAEDASAEAAPSRDDSRRTFRRGAAAPAPLPFQFQIPIGGGAPSLAMPIGGSGSPFAFAVPLGGTPAPAPVAPAPAAAAPAPAAAAPATPAATAAGTLPPYDAPPVPPLAAVPASAYDAPVIVAGPVDISPSTGSGEDEAASFMSTGPIAVPAPGLSMLTAAEASFDDARERGGPRTPHWLGDLMARVLPDIGAVPSATALYHAFVQPDAVAGRRHLRDRFARFLVPVAGPGTPVHSLRVLPGDLLLRVALGQDFGHVAVVASPVVCRGGDLRGWGWRAPGDDSPRGGLYVQVVELQPRVRRLADRWARRIADARGLLLPGTLLLRRRHAIEPLAPDREELLRALAEDSATDVRWLQDALNQVMGTHLVVDGDAGPATRGAVRDFQQQHGLAVDGIAGPRTLAALHDAIGRQGGGSPSPSRSGGGRAPAGGAPTSGPCVTLDHFPQGGSTLSQTHITQIGNVAADLLRSGARAVLVTGFASFEGADVPNFVLGMQRATRVSGELRSALELRQPGSSARIAIVPASRGESEQIAGGDFELNRRVTICPQVAPQPQPQPTPVSTRVFRLVAKSFIGPIGSRYGSLQCQLDSTVSTVARIISPIGGAVIDWLAPDASDLALHALATATDAAFSEDPHDDRIFTSPPPESKGYRLFSRGQLYADCRGTDLVSLSLGPLGGAIDTDSGKECLPHLPVCMQAPPLIIDQPFVTRRIDGSRVAFRWGVKGRPPQGAEIGLEIPCLRSSVYIWHQIDGVVDCSSGTATVTGLTLTGSRFPSHRLWLDGVLAQDIRQGPLSGLWDGAAGDPTRVR